MKSIDKKKFMKVNEVLSEYSPSALCDGLETLVAMLRNSDHATPYDVQLYFMDYEKLMMKFQRINPTDLSLALVQQHGSRLREILPIFTDRNDVEYKYMSGLECFI